MNFNFDDAVMEGITLLLCENEIGNEVFFILFIDPDLFQNFIQFFLRHRELNPFANEITLVVFSEVCQENLYAHIFLPLSFAYTLNFACSNMILLVLFRQYHAKAPQEALRRFILKPCIFCSIVFA